MSLNEQMSKVKSNSTFKLNYVAKYRNPNSLVQMTPVWTDLDEVLYAAKALVPFAEAVWVDEYNTEGDMIQMHILKRLD
jgi:hypothetical protein